MTKGQIESKISEAMSKFELEQMGRGPEKIRTIIFQDLMIFGEKFFNFISTKKHHHEKNLHFNSCIFMLFRTVATLQQFAKRRKLDRYENSVQRD